MVLYYKHCIYKMFIACLIIFIIGYYLVTTLPQYRDIIMFITFGLFVITYNKTRTETMIDQLSVEAVKNISSVYNGDTLRVQNLEVTNGAKIGKINIRNDRVGMDGSVDLLFYGDNIIFHPYGKADRRTNLVVGKINSDNNITALNAKIGSVNIRDNRLGVEGKVDIRLDRCVDTMAYGTNNYGCLVSQDINSLGDVKRNNGRQTIAYDDPVSLWKMFDNGKESGRAGGDGIAVNMIRDRDCSSRNCNFKIFKGFS